MNIIWTPLLFRTEMVEAIQSGTKTETRRLVNPQPFTDPKWGLTWEPKGHASNKPSYCEKNVNWNPISKAFENFYQDRRGSRYGGKGDMIRVKETFQLFRENNGKIETWKGQLPKYKPHGWMIAYRALDPYFAGGWRTGRFMPRWASRITLEITNIRYQQLHDITENEAIAEGIDASQPFKVPYKGQYMATPLLRYEALWDSINGDEPLAAWEANPWVCVIDFKRV